MMPDLDSIGRMALGGLLVLTFVFASMLWTVRGLFSWVRGHFSGFDDLSAKREGGKVKLSGVLVDEARLVPKARKVKPGRPLVFHDTPDGKTHQVDPSLLTPPLDDVAAASPANWNWGTYALVAVFVLGGIAWLASRMGG